MARIAARLEMLIGDLAATLWLLRASRGGPFPVEPDAGTPEDVEAPPPLKLSFEAGWGRLKRR
ncbi:MAG: hypothetical protein JO048_05955 [Methylobacteriaceae bacterium]|nr:hypothetical protein [Methylobacteriaceae bacterium]